MCDTVFVGRSKPYVATDPNILFRIFTFYEDPLVVLPVFQSSIVDLNLF